LLAHNTALFRIFQSAPQVILNVLDGAVVGQFFEDSGACRNQRLRHGRNPKKLFNLARQSRNQNKAFPKYRKMFVLETNLKTVKGTP
jgi:hypothetical protein